MSNKRKIILMIVLIFIVILMAYKQTNNIFKETPKTISNYKFNLNDSNLNYNNALNYLYDIAFEKHTFGTEENERVFNTITNYLDKAGVNYFVQDDILDYDYWYDFLYYSKEEFIESMIYYTPDFKDYLENAYNGNIDLYWEDQFKNYRNIGIDVNDYDDYMLVTVCGSLDDCEYRSYEEYINHELNTYYKKFIGTKMNNIIISLGEVDNNKDSIILSAHYDSGLNLNDENVSYGASDDGMNVAALIENARVLKDEKFNNNVYIALVNAEENNLWGAEYLVNSNVIKNIKLIINFDNGGEGGHLLLYRYNNGLLAKNFIQNIKNSHTYSLSEYFFKYIDLTFGLGYYGSDYEVYAKKYNSMDFALFMANDNYHTDNDTYENINIDSFKETINTIYELINYYGNDTSSYDGTYDIWSFEIMNNLVLYMNRCTYNIVIYVLLIMFIPYLFYLLIRINILKLITNIILYVLCIISLFILKDITILLILPLVINSIISLFITNIKYIYILGLINYLLFLFISSQLIFKIVSINRLGLLGFIISILYFINFVVLLKKYG